MLAFSVTRLSHGLAHSYMRKSLVICNHSATQLTHPLVCCIVCLVYKWLKHAANVLLHVQHTHTLPPHKQAAAAAVYTHCVASQL